MAATAAEEQTSGTITLGGKPYTWTAPTFETMEHVEATIGRILDPTVFDSFRGRVHLLAACLKERHPDMNPGQLGKIVRTTDFERVWEVICQAIPLWKLPKANEEAGDDTSSKAATPSGDGDHPKPEESA